MSSRIIDTINRLLDEKRRSNISPLVIPFSELANERTKILREELNDLYVHNKIKPVKLINGMGITL